ncbi:hypothetical protein [Heliophilum fasciatum]|uniref:hypothetical protein n=1 Tax=Heliophilum fasciatum TaxID=35700 RepID=UPI003C12C607
MAREIRNRVLSAWRSEADRIRRLFLAGGGGKAMADHLGSLHPTITLMKDAQMANALGYLDAAKIKEQGQFQAARATGS